MDRITPAGADAARLVIAQADARVAGGLATAAPDAGPGAAASFTTHRAIRLAAVALLVLGFVVAGVFGRFPWKADEPYTFGILQHMVESGRWLVPQVADQPFVEKPPLVYWLGAAAVHLAPNAPPHEASRLALLALIAVTLAALGAAARWLWPEAVRWRRGHPRDLSLSPAADSKADAALGATPHGHALGAALLFAGTLGFTEHIHKLTVDIGQLAGAALALAGLVRLGTLASADTVATSRRRAGLSGVLLGSGVGIAFMSKGLFVPAVVVLAWLLCLPMAAYRGRAARRAAAAALASATPWLVIWPFWLWRAEPTLFREWFWDNNFGRFSGRIDLGGAGVGIVDRISSLALASFPALPMALAVVAIALWRGAASSQAAGGRRDAWAGHCGVAAFALAALLALFGSATFRDNYLLPLLPALVLLGLPLLTMPGMHPTTPSSAQRQRVMQTAVQWLFGAIAISVVALWLQLVFTGTLAGTPLRQLAGRMLPLPFDLPFHAAALAIAAAAGLLWAYLTGRHGLRSTLAAWCAGAAMIWVVTASLLLPWVDAARSYRGVFGDLAGHLPAEAGCIATSGLGESELAMLEYVGGRPATRVFEGHSGSGDASRPNAAAGRCRWLLVLSHGEPLGPPDAARWAPTWHGSRPGDRHERFDLYRVTGKRPAIPPEP